MKKLLLMAGFAIAGFASAQTFQQTGYSNGNYTYTYTSTCGATQTFVSQGAELTMSTGLITAANLNLALCGSTVTSFRFISMSIE